MAYNNGFPINYPQAQFYYPQQNQYYPQNVQMQTQPQVQPQTQQAMMTPPTIHAEIIQVDGEQSAADYPLSAGSSQMMMAKDDSAIYVKTMYANGQYNLDVFLKRPNAPKKREIDPDVYVTRDEFESRLKSLLEAQKGNVKADKKEKKGEE